VEGYSKFLQLMSRSEVQTCIWPSWCHCHSLSLASVKSRLVSPFWYWLSRVVPDKGPLDGRVCVICSWFRGKIGWICVYMCLFVFQSVKKIVEASEEELALCPGLGPQKVSSPWHFWACRYMSLDGAEDQWTTVLMCDNPQSGCWIIQSHDRRSFPL